MSLQDGTSKMSKSAESDLSRINLLDPPDVMVQKVKVGTFSTVKDMGAAAVWGPRVEKTSLDMGCIGVGLDLSCQNHTD